MPQKRSLIAVALVLIGVLAGAGIAISSIEVNRYTSTDAFCTSCHTMAVLAAEPKYRVSIHRMNRAGILASCADCHIPTTGWFWETYVHVTQAVRDTYAELTGNFGDPAIWAARRIELAREVHEIIRGQDSVTCRKCHDAAAIRPASESGRTAHASLAPAGKTCIDCHRDAGHAAAAGR